MLRVLVFINKLGTGAFYLVYMRRGLLYWIMAEVQNCFSLGTFNFSHRSVYQIQQSLLEQKKKNPHF